MKFKALIICILPLVTAAYIITGFAAGSDGLPDIDNPDIQVEGRGNNTESGPFSDSTAAGSPEVIAYYFHTTNRCASCKKIEAFSEEAIETGFKEELDEGRLEFHSVNIDEPENKHYLKDYRLYTKSLIICKMRDGGQVEWKNLIKVWQLIRNKEEFIRYVQEETAAYLRED